MQNSRFIQLNATERKKLIIIVLEDSAFQNMSKTEYMIKEILNNIHFQRHIDQIMIKCSPTTTMHYDIEKLKERMGKIAFVKKEESE